MSNPSLLDVVSYMFNRVRPKLFLTLGDHAKYVQCVPQPILGLGIDPWPMMSLKSLPPNQLVYPVTCDYFFHSPYMIKELHPDIVLISGYHRFEQVLRDIIFSEKLCKKESVIMVANTYPLAKEDIDRADITQSQHQTGDVYKIIPIFRQFRPDLKVTTLTDVDKGLTIIENLDEANHVLQHDLVHAVEDVIDTPFDKRDTSTDATFDEYKQHNP